jgi:hypothetical protein
MLKITSKLSNYSKFILSIWTYLGWFGCVYFGKIGWSWGTVVFPAVSVILLTRAFRIERKVWFRLGALFLFGLLFDSIGVHFAWIRVEPSVVWGWLPVWLISLWLLFVTSLPLMQSLLQKKYWLAALVGAVFGPLSYRAGEQFGILFLEGWQALLIYAGFWALYMPCAVFWLGQRKENR